MDWAALFLSLRIATCATVLAVACGTALAIVLGWRRLPARDLLDAVLSSPLVLPPTVLGYYLLVTLGATTPIGRAWEAITGGPLAFTFTGAVIAATVGSLPLVMRSVRVALEAVDPTLLAAARTLGASPARVLRTIALPLAAPGILAGAMLGFARALGDYGITVMFAGSKIDGVPPVSIAIVDDYVASHDAAAREMALITTLVGIALLYVANRLMRRLRRG